MTGTTDTEGTTGTTDVTGPPAPGVPAGRGPRRVSRRTALKGAAALTTGAVGLTT